MKLYQILALVAFFNGAAALPALSEFKLKASQGLRLLELGEGLEPVWKTEAEKTALMEKSINFVSKLHVLDNVDVYSFLSMTAVRSHGDL